MAGNKNFKGTFEGIITVRGDEHFLNSLKASLFEYKEERFKTKIRKERAGKEYNRWSLKIYVDANDATALRAGLNSYLRILQCLNDLTRWDNGN